MSIKSSSELEALTRIGRIVRLALDEMAKSVRPGVTTAELSAIGANTLSAHAAVSTPKMVYGFPEAVCISVNNEAVHGIPGKRILNSGDLVKLDLVAQKGGLFADAAVTVRVGDVSPEADAVLCCGITPAKVAIAITAKTSIRQLLFVLNKSS